MQQQQNCGEKRRGMSFDFFFSISVRYFFFLHLLNALLLFRLLTDFYKSVEHTFFPKYFQFVSIESTQSIWSVVAKKRAFLFNF